MPHSVLILDDDVDFNSLLTDIFEQADYAVTPLTDPSKAVDAFRETPYDIVVTDHKMPGMSGTEFMAEIKKIRPEVPVIMVSGYLDNDTIRELIGEGVGGVFLKPLNIFSLLERTNELIGEVEQKSSGARQKGSGEKDGRIDTKLGFSFRSFPCRSEVSSSFAERLYSLRDFGSALTLIGEQGTHFRRICDDILGFCEGEGEQLIFFDPRSFDSSQALSLIEQAKSRGAERVTCALLEFEKMSEAQKSLAASLPKGDGDFRDAGVDLRAIYCVKDDVDSLFDQGLIDENLYILMGTTEVRVPPLRECRADLGVMAQQIVAELAEKKGMTSIPHFKKAARDFLVEQSWKGNYEELWATVQKLMDFDPGETLTLNFVKSVIEMNPNASPRAEFDSYLSSQKVDLLRAAAIFFGGEHAKVARFFAIDADEIASKLQKEQ